MIMPSLVAEQATSRKRRLSHTSSQDIEGSSKRRCTQRPCLPLPRRTAAAPSPPLTSLPRPSGLLSAAVRWLVEHPGILFPSLATAQALANATGRTLIEATKAFDGIRKRMHMGRIPQFFRRPEHANRWCAGYWHMRRLKEEKSWSRLSHREKEFCIAFEEEGRVVQHGCDGVVLNAPARLHVIDHLNRIRSDLETAYKRMIETDTNLSAMGHFVKNCVTAVSAEEPAQVGQGERHPTNISDVKAEPAEAVYHREPDRTRSFNDWAANFLHANRNRKHAREISTGSERPLKRARSRATSAPIADESSLQPAVLPVQFLQNVAPETITSWFDSSKSGRWAPRTAIDPLFGATNLKFTDISHSKIMDVQHELGAERAKRIADPTLEPTLDTPEWLRFESSMLYGRWWNSEGILAPRELELAVGEYEWNPETWGVKGVPSVEDNATLEGSTLNATRECPLFVHLDRTVRDRWGGSGPLLSFISQFA